MGCPASVPNKHTRNGKMLACGASKMASCKGHARPLLSLPFHQFLETRKIQNRRTSETLLRGDPAVTTPFLGSWEDQRCQGVWEWKCRTQAGGKTGGHGLSSPAAVKDPATYWDFGSKGHFGFCVSFSDSVLFCVASCLLNSIPDNFIMRGLAGTLVS